MAITRRDVKNFEKRTSLMLETIHNLLSFKLKITKEFDELFNLKDEDTIESKIYLALVQKLYYGYYLNQNELKHILKTFTVVDREFYKNELVSVVITVKDKVYYRLSYDFSRSFDGEKPICTPRKVQKVKKISYAYI